MLAIVAAVMLAAASQHDTVFTSDTGRVVGTVVEEGPRGIAVQLLDGTYRRFARRDVVRIEYATAPSRSRWSRRRRARSAPPPTYAPAPPPYTPPPPQQGYPPHLRHTRGRRATRRRLRAPSAAASRSPATDRVGPRAPSAALSRPSTSPSASAARSSPERPSGNSTWTGSSSQPNLPLEGGLRLAPHPALALYGDVGAGEPGRETRGVPQPERARLALPRPDGLGFSCASPSSPPPARLRGLAAGTGFEFGNICADDGVHDTPHLHRGRPPADGGRGLPLQPRPRDRVLRGRGFGRYNHVEDRFGVLTIDEDLGRQPFHTTVEGGIRFTLFP